MSTPSTPWQVARGLLVLVGLAVVAAGARIFDGAGGLGMAARYSLAVAALAVLLGGGLVYAALTREAAPG